ncbi:MAG: hypothetical protein DRO04_02715 [Candidatus Iainarchaeum archaeon]|uniref:Uncharacterized protein n=1 Tax=Candidatus Iainarchaeum sp. TaxID=3101447 RepID=A0A497JFX3_9ARCH|nr:MAG: hypothetical protein DRO04_02715 [Candidatus Diapherotrites archaeon]
MKLKCLNRKGFVFTWLAILIFLFAVITAYIILDQPLKEVIFPMAQEDFNVSEEQINNLRTIWDLMPFVFAFALFIYGILAVTTREPHTGWI